MERLDYSRLTIAVTACWCNNYCISSKYLADVSFNYNFAKIFIREKTDFNLPSWYVPIKLQVKGVY